MKNAVVAGSTGMIGKQLCLQLARSPDVNRVVALTRRPLDFSCPSNLVERIADFGQLGRIDPGGDIDTAFCTLGSTIKLAGSQEAFRLVDFDYTIAFARFARKAGARTFVLLTSVDSSSDSRNFYLRVKGDAEKSVASVGFESLYLARPSFLMGDRQQSRTGEKIGITIARAFQFALVGPLRKYHPIEASVLAAGMIAAAQRSEPGQHILHYDKLAAH
jgi:uncharacterized protein YbjT (DUF2867 family)